MLFAGGEPDHHCAISANQTLNETIPLEKQSDGTYSLSKCKKYVNFTLNNVTMDCDNGWYYAPEYKETIITEVGVKTWSHNSIILSTTIQVGLGM